MPNNSGAVGSLHTYAYPRTCPKSVLFRVRANGQDVFVHATGVADFACISFSGEVEIEIEITGAITSALVRPLSRGIQPSVVDGKIRFTLDRPLNLQIEVDDLKPLHFYGNPLEENRPSPDDPSVLYFKGGQIYEVGRLSLKDGQTIYLEGGAILKGAILASHANNIRICGRGVLDGSYYRDGDKTKSIVLDHCENVLVEDIIMIEPTLWMLVLGACRQVRVTNLKQIGEVVSSDGIDIVGSKDVIIDGCFLKNNDDCVVVKSYLGKESAGVKFNWIEDVDNVLVQNCVLMNDRAGNAMEIGHELRCDSIRNVTFRNIDVLHVHGHGAVFSIHNSDHARVSDILWEDIRIEHCFDMLLDLRVLKSMWSGEEEYGSIENIRLKNIHWQRTIYNPGYTKSLIGGWSQAEPVRNVVIEDLYFDDRKITNQDEMDLFIKSAEDVTIK
jgi:hypothetical protein